MTIPTEVLTKLDAVTAQRLIGEGTLSSVALTQACIAAIRYVDPVVNAMITTAFEAALQAAQAADMAVRAGKPLGALHGLPVAIKDIQATAGLRTTYGSADFSANVPEQDDGIVARIRAAGGIVIGKTNVPERSIGANTVNRLFGATGNPYGAHLTCGGSSGGSAVAVATGMAPLATGSDHGGSLRIPACYCGVVGFRATPGVVPNEQRAVTQTNYSVQGPMARTVGDAALLLSVIADRSSGAHRDPMAFPLDASSFRNLRVPELGDLRVAVTADLGGVMVSDQVKRTFTARVGKLTGAVRVCDWHPLDLTGAPNIDWHLRQDIFAAQYADEADTWDSGFNPNVRATFDSALQTPMLDIARARRQQMRLFQQCAALFDDYDVVLCPGVSVPPFPWEQLNPQTVDGQPVTNYMAWLALTASLTVVGHPVVALPCGTDDQGLPFGIQVVGSAYSDRQLLGIAAALEAYFAADPELAAPAPDLDRLVATGSDCRTRGKTVA